MLELFLDNLLPVFLAAGAGFLLSSRLRVETRSIAHIGFYVLAPCLIFRLLVENPLQPGQMLRMGVLTVLVMGLPAILASGIGRLAGWPRALIAAVTLSVFLPNAGNFGLSANHFAFGDEALTHAGMFFVSAAILTYTGGVLVASLGRASLGEATRKLLRVPTLWAVLVGILIVALKLSLPLPLERTVYLLSDACIPVFLLILGMQLKTMRFKGAVGPLSLVVVLRLVGGAVVGILMARLTGMTGAQYQAAVLEAGMPVAVITTVLATEYNIEPDFVTGAVFVSTLICPLTLTPLIGFLQ